MSENNDLLKQSCACSFESCTTKGTVGEKFTDTKGKERYLFYCTPDSPSSHDINDYKVICYQCASRDVIKVKYPEYFKNRGFLPALVEKMGIQREEITREIIQDTQSGSYLSVYQKQFASLTAEEREHAATNQRGEYLLALCHDSEPRVIKRVLENHYSGLEHARLIAKFHKNSQGLEFIICNSKLLQDNRVQNNLLKNPVLNDSQIKRILNSKTLLQAWNIASSHEIPDKNKQNARKIVKEKFIKASAEQRASLIYDSEGRVLVIIHDIPFGQQTTVILCRKTYHSVLLIRNLATCSKTPGKLLKHLEIQNIVKRNKAIKRLIRTNPNYPKSSKK